MSEPTVQKTDCGQAMADEADESRRETIVVVTGASGGIGAAICAALSADGHVVVAQFASNRAQAERLARVVSVRGGTCVPVQADLTTHDGLVAVVDTVTKQLASRSGARLAALVNNAALMQGPSLSAATFETFDAFVHLNVRAPFFLIQALSTMMTAGASIVNISSASAHIASGGDPIYAMTKSAVESLTRNLAIELGANGIRVNGVIPGYTDNGHPMFQDPAARQYMGEMSVLGDVASPSTVADAVTFLVSDAAARTTGSFIDVSAGMTLRPRRTGAAGVRSTRS
ncbi:SDR family NAD(P)-dependent oxidoreductase [Microbacterium gorillae]|uniref:SDR family NAD(P)-dependent oxidoreductase n=1 Tax=Microbacterium gorillae TaxID=1231063 RepID=UPI003D95782B